MKYYGSPDGTKEALRSRIRRFYVALCELQPAVEYLYYRIDQFNEDYTVTDVEIMYERHRKAARELTGRETLSALADGVGLERVEERLFDSPIKAEEICDMIRQVQYGAKSVIRNIEYQLDAGHFDPEDDLYQSLREHALTVLGLTSIVLDAIDSGFITDVSIYNETGQ